jgi:hypothetical protein
VDPKWLSVKVVAFCNVGLDRCVSHHLQSLMGAIEFIVLCAFVCKVRPFDAQIRKTLLYK